MEGILEASFGNSLDDQLLAAVVHSVCLLGFIVRLNSTLPTSIHEQYHKELKFRVRRTAPPTFPKHHLRVKIDFG
jgi:hypothetical protein